ncbi:MAG: MDR family MFS transporter [Casimicrobiaceae bacterium]
MTPVVDLVRRRWILAALMMTMMLAAMDITIVSTAIPQIVSELGGFAQFGWVFSIFLLAQTITIPIYGKLADMFGRKPVLLFGTLVFLAGSVASALAWNMPTLIVFRGLQGVGAGSIMATVNTLAGDLYSVKERARIQGWLSSVWGVSAIVGPVLGGALAEYASWRWIFLINLPIGAVAVALIARFLHEDAHHHRHRVDYAGALVMLLAVGTLILGLLEGGRAWPWLSLPGVGVFVVAGLLTALTIAVERRAPEAIMPGWLWRHPVLVATNLAMIGMGVVLMGPNAYLPTFGQSVLGLGAIAAGFVLAGMILGWPLASSVSGRLYLRIGFRDTALIGAALMVIGALWFLALPQDTAAWVLTVDQFVLGAGFGLLSTPLLVGVQSSADWRERGVVTSANIFSRYLGQSVGAAIFGALFNNAIAARLADAPAALAVDLPRDVDGIIGALHRHALPAAADEYLRTSIYIATHHVYAGAAAFAIITLAFVLWTPRHFPPIAIGSADAAPTPPA